MEFYSLAGKMALGSRLRRLADSLSFEAGKIYELYGVNIDPKWFPGYLYVPDGGSPEKYSDLNETETTEIESIEQNWYYVSHH